MGIRGLTTYIADHSKSYLKPYKLCNSYLVIDGNNIAAHLYKWVSKSDSAFGGDYDEYFKTVKDFFLVLQKCNVTPIVLFDGGYEKRKLSTILSRAGARLPILRAYAKGFSTAKFYPLFLKETFFNVTEDLGIFCIQCDLEADVEIAAVARALKCPVLSYDSDFYIFDVLYIPFSSLCIEPVKFEDSGNYYVKCSIYDVTNFLNEFTGLDKSLLPIIATLLGNDYIESSVFQKFFGHVIMPKNKNKSYTQRKIHGLLHWLKKENVESATKLIISHLEKKNAEKVINAIKTSIRDYTNVSVSESVINKLTSQMGDISLDKKNFGLNLPSEIIQLYCQCRIHKLIIDMITLGIYFTQLQVENVHHQSSHFPSLQLIKNIYILLTPYMERKPKFLKLYLTLKNQYTAIKLEYDSFNFLSNIYLHDILKESKEERLKWLCSIVEIDDNDLNIVSSNNWSLFLMSFIYWIKKLNNSISFAHIHALILMAISNQAVQRYVGFFRNYSKFMKSKGNLLGKLRSTPVTASECTDFEEMLKSVTLYEKLLIQSILIPFRQSTEKGKGKAYCISTMHLFGCFQSCLFHIMQVNALLNYPLPQLKINDFYSGTLLFNFYLIIRTKPQVEKFGCNLFKETPNLKKIYTYLCENLCKFSEKASIDVKKKKKKKNKKTKILSEHEENFEEVIHHEEDNDEYDDESNPYAILQKGIRN